ncbi:hypothetical protein [Bacillus sp. LL01]|uniref:hypothetical protein n=1 Tax=Bacillus sp. LL01 TaxID=1665556 RepID=UPI0012FF407A|nr:hypothetical protein [Bacillus sp. LL01]
MTKAIKALIEGDIFWVTISERQETGKPYSNKNGAPYKNKSQNTPRNSDIEGRLHTEMSAGTRIQAKK